MFAGVVILSSHPAPSTAPTQPLSASPFDNGGVSTAETERAQSRTMARTGPRGGGGGGLRGRLPNSTRLDLSAPSLSAALAQR